MAALCRNACKKLSLNTFFTTNVPVCFNVKRNLRTDPEYEFERLFITESLQEKLSKLEKSSLDTHSHTDTDSITFGDGLPKVKVRDGLPIEDQQGHSLNKERLRKHTTRAQRFSNSLLLSRFDQAGLKPINLTGVNDTYMLESDPVKASEVLNHYGVLSDLLNVQANNVVFYPDPSVNLRIAFDLDSDEVLPVFRGNKVHPEYTSKAPSVGFEGKSENYYTLLLVNLDGHLQKADGEYLHWFCANMTSDEGLPSGEDCSYLQAIPLRGTGFHRYVFVLLEHKSTISLSLLPDIVEGDLASREFSFSNFYSQLDQSNVVPIDVRFFQSEWDPTVKHIFHHVLDMPEPAYAYDYPPIIRKTQTKHAPKQPFQSYLDKYRDKKEVAEEVIKEHLSEISPYSPLESQQLPYPLAKPTKPGVYHDQLPPTWMQKNAIHKVKKTGKYKYIYSGDS